MRAVTMAEVLGSNQNDIFEDCRKKVQVLDSNEKYRLSAEIVLKDGNRRYYRARTVDKNSAAREILTFVSALEQGLGYNVMWRFAGEDKYHFSTNYQAKPSIFQQAKSAFFRYFFELEA